MQLTQHASTTLHGHVCTQMSAVQRNRPRLDGFLVLSVCVALAAVGAAGLLPLDVGPDAAQLARQVRQHRRLQTGINGSSGAHAHTTQQPW